MKIQHNGTHAFTVLLCVILMDVVLFSDYLLIIIQLNVVSPFKVWHQAYKVSYAITFI